jgi:hypothetical protein
MCEPLAWTMSWPPVDDRHVTAPEGQVAAAQRLDGFRPSSACWSLSRGQATPQA